MSASNNPFASDSLPETNRHTAAEATCQSHSGNVAVFEPAEPAERIGDFLRLLYGEGIDAYLNIWTLPGRTSRWFRVGDTDEISKTCIQLSRTHNVYFQTGLMSEAMGRDSRGEEQQVIGVPGVHADIDILNPVAHKASNLPPTVDDALKLLDAVPVEPTVIVHTGNGLQAYWLFDTPYHISNAEERQRFKSLLVSWQAKIQSSAKAFGWKVDGTSDLVRVYRIPGTFNRKEAQPKKVVVQAQSNHRYTMEQLEHISMFSTDVLASNDNEIDLDPFTTSESPPCVPSVQPADDWISNEGDGNIINQMFTAQNGEKVKACWEGRGIYPSTSEAVQALVTHIAYWTRCSSQIRRIALHSPLCRNHAKCQQRDDYLDISISKALALTEMTTVRDDSTSKNSNTAQKMTQAQRLVELKTDIELFHDADTPYATVPGDDSHRQNHALRSQSFRQWLTRRYYLRSGSVPGAQAMQDALNILAAEATFKGPQRLTAVRLGGHEGNVYLDLANEKWEAVEITGNGWQVISNPPIKFIRRSGMLALPTPIRGGKLDQLRPVINATDDDTWVLLMAWLVGSLRPQGPYPILSISGEQGSAKSTTSRMLRRLIDPNAADLRAAPRDERDLMIGAINSWVVAYDNLSGMSPDLSDSLCRLATGGGFATRALYTDDAEKLFHASRPILLNGIEELGSRPDLLERSVTVHLPTIAEEGRSSEATLWRTYEQVRPAVLGALLDAVSAAIRNLSSVSLTKRPRMADFAEWVVAAEPALPWTAGKFMDVYARNRQDADQLAVEVSPIGPAVQSLLEDNEHWQGTPGRLLSALSERYCNEQTKRRRDWPVTPKGMSVALRRLAPSLRKVGINVIFGAHTKNGTSIRLERVGVPTDAEGANEGKQEPLW